MRETPHWKVEISWFGFQLCLFNRFRKVVSIAFIFISECQMGIEMEIVSQKKRIFDFQNWNCLDLQ